MHLSSPKKHHSKIFDSLMPQEKGKIRLVHESVQLANKKQDVVDVAHKEYKDHCFAAPNGAKIKYGKFYDGLVGATQ